MKQFSSEPTHLSLLIRPIVRELAAYVPGEQPQIEGLIKLNTNENPYPPSPKVLAAVRAAADARLRLYPNPTAQPLRERLAKLHGCSPDHLIVGNGSDELLEMATRAFVEPVPPSASVRLGHGTQTRLWPLRAARRSHSTVQYFNPSYSLYPVLANMHGALVNPVPLAMDFTLPPVRELRQHRQWDFAAALTFITTPNAPTGSGCATAELEALCKAQQGVVVLDETYVDFARENALELALRYPHVLVSRTFSKAYSLCALRVGYFVGHPELIAALHRIRDSYNVNGLAQVAALATLDDLPYYQKNFKRILATRQRLSEALGKLGFTVFPSQANFLLVQPPGLTAREWLGALREHKVLVRWFEQPEVEDCLRISIGTEAETDALLHAVKAVLAKA
jgi:histidinol-phosphate aminotransferase